MRFDSYNCPLKIEESIRILTPKVRAHLGVCGFTPSLSYTPENMKCDYQASLLAHIFASLCLSHKPKTRVVTLITSNVSSFILISPLIKMALSSTYWEMVWSFELPRNEIPLINFPFYFFHHKIKHLTY
jgi:hypothetical protein